MMTDDQKCSKLHLNVMEYFPWVKHSYQQLKEIFKRERDRKRENSLKQNTFQVSGFFSFFFFRKKKELWPNQKYAHQQ